MLDQDIKEQLKAAFASLSAEITLRVSPSTHENQSELDDLLSSLAETSPNIKIEHTGQASTAPQFELLKDSKSLGVSFRGVPGGHEFTSLILSILYADGKGRQPDDGVLARVRALKGPIKLKTYISLTCENCPEVVQALNLMATHHPEFEHEMVDGAVAQDEIEALGIQGVPAVFSDGKLVHSGKIQFIDLLAKLENTFGKSDIDDKPQDLGLFDVAVIGGGPAGASAAIYSARKGLKTVIIAERFGGQLQETKGIENMISVPYTEGVRLSAELGKHVASYPIKLLEYRRVSEIENEVATSQPRRIQLEGGEFLNAKTIILATGAKWRMLGIPGEKEHIGQGVAFCAHCDGPFYKGKRVAVVGGGNSGVEAAIDLAAIAETVTLLEYSEKLKADDVLVAKLKALPNVTIVTQAKTSQILGNGQKVHGLEYVDRTSDTTKVLELDGVFVQIGLLPNSQFVKGLVELTSYGEIVVDARGRTSKPGIYAAGDVTTVPLKQIVIAMGDGAKVALSAFEDQMRAG